jgi:hypothetical protein
MAAIRRLGEPEPEPVADLLKVAFCSTLISRAKVSFGHQSMSFRKQVDAQLSVAEEVALVVDSWEAHVQVIGEGASSQIQREPRVIRCDARDIRAALERDGYSCVITSPPYPNRMSYIRELRPYMYWLGYLNNGRAAGELDWQAIGGTWGCATSNVSKWQPEQNVPIPYEGFDAILAEIAATSPLLSRYVAKYFHDMAFHCRSLHEVVRPGGAIHYIVGNSKFYEIMLPTERILAGMLDAAGFEGTTIRTMRKRTSKRELFEFVVSAKKPT